MLVLQLLLSVYLYTSIIKTISELLYQTLEMTDVKDILPIYQMV